VFDDIYDGKSFTFLLNNLDGLKSMGLSFADHVADFIVIKTPMSMQRRGNRISHAIPNVSLLYYLNLLIKSA
jgi:hypothetical protein